MAVPKQYKGIIQKSANQWGLPPSLLAALLFQESGFNPNARSPVGALGIGQFMPSTAKQYGINPLNPFEAIPASAKYLGRNFKTYGGNVDKTLASYNAGAGAVAKYGGVPPYKETQNYVKRIKQLERQFAKEFGGVITPEQKQSKGGAIGIRGLLGLPEPRVPEPLLRKDLPFAPVLGATPSQDLPEKLAIGEPQMPFPFIASALGAASTAAPAMSAALPVAAGAKAAGLFSKLMGGAQKGMGFMQQAQGLLGGGASGGGGMVPYQQAQMVPMPSMQFSQGRGFNSIPVPQIDNSLVMQLMRRGMG